MPLTPSSEESRFRKVPESMNSVPLGKLCLLASLADVCSRAVSLCFDMSQVGAQGLLPSVKIKGHRPDDLFLLS